jgi:SDR family mycofactocin-dependent oxidoreductase
MSTAGRVEGKVAFITGAARGQGRSHAVRLAEEGADIIAIDVCRQLDTVPYPMAGQRDLQETRELVEKAGRRVLARQVDVRDLEAMQQVVADGVEMFGKLDIVCANAGIGTYGLTWEITEAAWQEMIDVNLGGVWKTIAATVPQLLGQGSGGSIILISSLGGLVGYPNCGAYCAAKHGVVGLMHTLAVELAPQQIRVNSVHPGTVATPMVMNDAMFELFSGGRVGATYADVEPTFRGMHALPIAMLESLDISNAVLYLASDEARYVTGTTHVVDAGASMSIKIPNGA